DDVGITVVHQGRQQNLRNCTGFIFLQDKKVIVGYLRKNRSPLRLPIRYQLVERDWVDYGTGEDVSTYGGRRFEHPGTHLTLLRSGLLLSPNCCRPPGRTGTHANYVVLPAVSLHEPSRAKV